MYLFPKPQKIKEFDEIFNTVIEKVCIGPFSISLIKNLENIFKKQLEIIDTQEINATGRATAGVCGIKLNEDDIVVCTHTISNNITHILSISKLGIMKKIPYSEFNIGSRATKGASIQKLKEDDEMANFLPLTAEDKELTLISTIGTIRIPIDTVEESSRGAQGIQSKKLVAKEYIIKVVK
jgi:DNA gyrase/topoisomerase IV subunit A